MEAKIIGTTYYQISIEVHRLIKKMKKYHILIHCAYDIIQAKIRGIFSKNVMLQIALKAVNNTVGSNSLISTLLVLGIYF